MPRHLAIGDIHGRLDALQTLVEFVGLRDDDVLVTLGNSRSNNSYKLPPTEDSDENSPSVRLKLTTYLAIDSR